MQRTIIKYTVPIASLAIGSSYNYITTKSIGTIAKAHLKNRGQATDELRILVSRQNTYAIAFPAAAMYMALADGEFSTKEKEFYRALLSRMSFEEHTQAEFQKLLASEKNILDAITQIEDEEIKHSLLDVIILMAIYDGNLAQKEREFLTKVATQLNIPLNMDEIEARTEDYRILVEDSFLTKTAGTVKNTTAKATNMAGQAAKNVKNATTAAGSRVSNTLGKVFRRDRENVQNMAVENNDISCSNCGTQISDEFKFCPSCGQSTATEKACGTCNKMIAIQFSFCPHCGVSQE